MIRALVFDFDGLIVDTEQVRYESWKEIYAQYGHELKLELYLRCVGSGHHLFSPYDHLEELEGKPVDRDAIMRQRDKRNDELCRRQQVLPGVERIIGSARERGLRVGVASSSSRSWVEPHLDRVGLLDAFDSIKCCEDVEQIKPDPALYQAVLAKFSSMIIAPSTSPNSVYGRWYMA